MVVGDKRKFLTAIIALDREAFLDELDSLGISGHPEYESLAKDLKIREVLEKEIEEVNKDLASFETIKGFIVAPSDFTIENGHITPSLKLKKKIIQKCYNNEINAMYQKLEK